MPITKRQFELRVDDSVEASMRQIYDFLASHKELAYSYKELFEAITADKSISEEEAKFGRGLDTLVSIGAVEKRDIEDAGYYAFLGEFDTKSWEPKTSPIEV